MGLSERRRALHAEAQSGVWRAFSTQAGALGFLHSARCAGEDGPLLVGAPALHLFSAEYPAAPDAAHAGARHFVVASYATFYARYMNTAARERHYYEVIHHEEPCHLYFDVEYTRAWNAQLASEECEERVSAAPAVR